MKRIKKTWRRLTHFAQRSFFHRLIGFIILLSVFFLTVLTPQALAYVETAQAANIEPSSVPTDEAVTTTSFQWPLKNYGLSQNFSWRHWGLDLTATEGTEIYPVAKGKIVEVGWAILGYGNYIVIDHQNGQQSLYAHLSKVEVKNGETVGREKVIGLIGHTGFATGNHLHLEIYSKSLPLDPLEVLPEN